MKQNWFNDRSAIFPSPIALAFFSFICPLHSAEHTKLPTAIRARVNSILHAIDTKRNQATASPTANQDEPSASEPSQSARGIHHRRDYGCSTVRADHGHGGFTIHCIPHNNSLWLRDDRCGSALALLRWRPIALWRWIALLWWVALLLWRIARLLWVSGLTCWRWIAWSLIRWRFIRHDEFFDRLQQLSKVGLHKGLICPLRCLKYSRKFKRSVESFELQCRQLRRG